MVTRRTCVLSTGLAMVLMSLLWFTRIPLGIPGEWTWTRIDGEVLSAEVLLGLVSTLIVGIVLLVFLWAGAGRIQTCSRAELAAWLGGLALVSFFWTSALQDTPPSPWGSGRVPFVIYYPASSGYFHKARYGIDGTARFLAGYETLMAEGDVLHVGTHPPGLFLLYRGLLDLTARYPAVRELAVGTVPDSQEASLNTIESHLRPEKPGLSTVDRATIRLAAVITQAACALTVIPLFVLIRLTGTRRTAWSAVAFWPLLPALTVFLPKSDVLFTFPAALLMAVWLLAVRHRSVTAGAMAGAVGWCGLLLSLVFLPVGLIAVLCGAATAREHGRRSELSQAESLAEPLLRQLWRPAAGGAIVFAVLTMLCLTLADLNLGKVWYLNYRNHAAFYAQFDRTWWKWLLVNPVELAFACGAPVAVLVCLGFRTAIRQGWHSMEARCTLSVMTVWSFLWLSGKNSGEAARLWIPLFPLLVWRMAAVFQRFDAPAVPSRATPAWLFLLGLQLIVAVLTVLRVSGFHLDPGGTGL